VEHLGWRELVALAVLLLVAVLLLEALLLLVALLLVALLLVALPLVALLLAALLLVALLLAALVAAFQPPRQVASSPHLEARAVAMFPRVRLTSAWIQAGCSLSRT
jgi:hypothetical protein